MSEPIAEKDAGLSEAEREGLIAAVVDGKEFEYVESLIAARLARVLPPGGGRA